MIDDSQTNKQLSNEHLTNNHLSSSLKGLHLRLFEEPDKPFLRQLYESTREWEMSMTTWGAEERKKFLDMQANAQQIHYSTTFPNAQHHIILRKNKLIGRIYVDYRQAEIRLLDIALMPAYRNKGIGSKLMRNLMQEGERTQKPVRFYVWQLNENAQRFYQRLGFSLVGEEGAYVLMEQYPPFSF